MESRKSSAIGELAWSGTLKSHLITVEVLERRFLTIILGKTQRYSSDKLLQKLKIFVIKQLFYYNVTAKYFIMKYPFNQPSHPMIQEIEETIWFLKSESLGKTSFSFNVRRIFNFLPQIRNVCCMNFSLFENVVVSFVTIMFWLQF